MTDILKIAKWEYIERIKSRWFIFSTLLFPLLIILISILPALLISKTAPEFKRYGIIDQSGIIYEKFNKLLQEKYKLKDGKPNYELLLIKEKDLESSKFVGDELIKSKNIKGYFVIEKDILISGKAEYYTENLIGFMDLARLENTLSAVVKRQRMINENIDPLLVAKIDRHIELKKFEIKKSGEKFEKDEFSAFFTPMIFVLILFMTIFISGQLLMRSVLAERTNRVVEMLISSVTPTDLMGGKILGLGSLGLTQMFFYLITGIGISAYRGMGIFNIDNVLYFLIYFILGYLLWAAIFATIGTIFSSEHEAQQAVGIFSLIGVLPIVLLSVAIQNPESTLIRILTFLPPVTPFFMIMRIGISTPGNIEIISTIVILVLSVLISIKIAGRIFQTAILMYGKRPTVPEIFRWLKAR